MRVDPVIAQLRDRQPRIEAYATMPHLMPPPMPAPLDPRDVVSVQALLGFDLPDHLVEVLTSVGNGGFGPRYGLLGLGDDGVKDDLGRTADQFFRHFRRGDPETPNLHWPQGLLPICHMGCAIYVCLDCTSDQMVLREPSTWVEDAPMKTGLFDKGTNLRDWLNLWVNGQDTVDVPGLVMDQPRSAIEGGS